MTFTTKLNVLQQSLDRASLLHRMIKQIRRSLDLQEILTTTATEVRSFLGTDRVKIYRFDADGSGEVIAESINQEKLPSLLGLHFPVHDIPPDAREMFLSLRQRSIVDVSRGRIGLSPLKSAKTGETLPTENIYYRAVDPCHIQYLQAMGVQSSIVVPILHYDLKQSSQPQLWGLLVSHNSQPRTVLKRELKVVQQIADQVAIAISQSNLLTEARTQQQQEVIVNRVSTLLNKLPHIQFQEALETTITAFSAIGGRLYIEPSGEIYTWGEQPKLTDEFPKRLMEQHPVWQNWMAEYKSGKVWAISDIYQQPELQALIPAFQTTPIRGMMVIPLYYRESFIGVLSLFRPAFDAEILWAGRCDQSSRQNLPRLSFEIWREQRKGQAPEWKSREISLAQALSSEFSSAIQEQEAYQQLHILNSNLEVRVQEQTAELEKSLLLTRAMKQVTDQIRSTLDLNTILQTIVREVRPLINSDRVVIYQIRNEAESKVVVEEINGNWRSVLGMRTAAECFPDEAARLYFQGRVRAINNVSAESLSPCHQEFLESLQVRANLIVPINMGTQLWGLLIAHQCDDREIGKIQKLSYYNN